ncbi:hypothetical protein Cgig2_032966 [Carnegiea gigantea]|uniref:Uncharacterized protein n=1 Tax=Carnegiea gigantea TaxID=171969 RepID=A0A9Q1QBR5_9CARY|nr:hypothetical protein Cgig2_032966 [Carnegiea gigantea]
MVVNDAMELGVISRHVANTLKLALKGLRWIIFESWLRINKHAVLGAQLRRKLTWEWGPIPSPRPGKGAISWRSAYGLYHGTAGPFWVSEMFGAPRGIGGLVPRFDNRLKLNKHALRLAQYCRQANPGARPRPASSQEENSESSDALPPSSDEE